MRNIFTILWFTLNGWLGGVFVAFAVALPTSSSNAPWWAWLLAAIAPAALIVFGLSHEHVRASAANR